MFDFNSLPIPGGILAAGITWAVISGFVLGPVVAERTIKNTGWHKSCPAKLRSSIAAQIPQPQSRPTIACSDVMKIFGNGADQICSQGGNAIFNLMTIDPLAGQKEQLRRREAARLSRIAAQSPSRCSCAALIVGADRLAWGVFAGSARLIGGSQNLQSDLMQALRAPACALQGKE